MPSIIPIRMMSPFDGEPKKLLVSMHGNAPPPSECVNSGHAAAFLARTTGLDATHIAAYTAFLNGLDSDNLSCLFDFLYIYATQDSTTALLNLIQDRFNGVAHGALTFAADAGYNGIDGDATVYIDTGFNPTAEVATANFQQNSAHLSVWNLTNAQSIFAPVGAANGSTPFDNNTMIFPEYTDGNAYFRVNVNGVGNPTAVGTPLGHFFADHAGVLNDCVHNGVSVGTYLDTSQAVLDMNFYATGINNNGTPVGSATQVAAISCGAFMDATQYANFYTHLRAYMTAVGVP